MQSGPEPGERARSSISAGVRSLRIDGSLARRHRARLIGDGADIVIFSHGLGTDQSIWAQLLDLLPGGHSALLFDLPGAGPLLPESFDPDDYRSLASFADDLLDLLDEIGVTRCRYVGHSVSGMIGALAAIEEPQRFEQLLLLNASPRYLNAPGYIGGFDQTDLEGLFDAMTSNYQAWVAGFAQMVVAADLPGAVADFSRGLLAMRPDFTVRIARMIFESDVRHLLRELDVPTVLIHSRVDVAVPAAVAEYLRDHIANAALSWIETSGHLPHLTAPVEVARILGAHLGR